MQKYKKIYGKKKNLEKKIYIKKKKKKKKVSHRVERVAMNMNLISPFMMGGLSIFNTSVVLEHKL